MGMDKREASQLDEQILVAKDGRVGESIISVNEHHTEDEPENRFESKFTGAIPSVIVGIEMPNRIYKRTVNNEVYDIPSSVRLLHVLGEKAIKSGVQTARELINKQVDYDCSFPKKRKVI